MNLRIGLLVLGIIIPATNGWFFSGPTHDEWDGLKATFGINPFRSFNNLPRLKQEAVSDGWVKYRSGENCTGNANFLGERYWKNNDLAIILIFDPAGYIAGIQAGIPKEVNQNNYPSQWLIGSPFVLEGNTYYITAYFVNPAALCRGRTAGDFSTQGTGTGLWIQNGTDPVGDSIQIPMRVQAADESMWTRGSCFPSMGQHYWYNTSRTMDCDRFYPVFLLYNGGHLNAFGWAFGMDITTSSHFEHPLKSTYRWFMDPVPTCLPKMGTLTTLHIYLTSSAYNDNC